MSVTPSQFELLARPLDASSLLHRVIAQNVADVNTPGYHRREVSFEDALAQLLEVKPVVVEKADGSARSDGNNVDILAAKIASMRAASSGR